MFIMQCPIHGFLDEKDTYTLQEPKEIWQRAICRKACFECLDIENRKNLYWCQHHGIITMDLVRINGSRLQCRLCHRASATKKRNSNREEYNKKIAEDKKNRPEKYKKLYRDHYRRLKERFGNNHSLIKQCASYGITLEKYNDLFDKQKGLCAICNQKEKCINKTSTGQRLSRLSIDHCHNTGKVRGLLCRKCNSAIGKMSDNIELLQKAINYLKSHLG